MWTLIAGFAAGCATTVAAYCVMDHKLKAQKRAYEEVIRQNYETIDGLQFRDAYQQGRQYEMTVQNTKFAQMTGELQRLHEENADLRRQLGLEVLFDHRLKTQGRATMTSVRS